MKRQRNAHRAGRMAIVITMLLGACTHTQRDSHEPSVTTQAIKDAANTTEASDSKTLTFQARTVFTHPSGTQESFTLLCQLNPAQKRVDLWLVSDFGASVFQGFSTLGGESGIRSNQTSHSKTRLEHLLLIPLVHTLHLSLLDEETLNAFHHLPRSSDDLQRQTQRFFLENGYRRVHISRSGSVTDPEKHYTFPNFIVIRGSSSDPEITISILSISAS